MIICLNQHGFAHFKQKQYQKAIDRFDRIVCYYEEHGVLYTDFNLPAILVLAHSNRQYNYQQLGKHAEARKAKEDELDGYQRWIGVLEEDGVSKSYKAGLTETLANTYAEGGKLHRKIDLNTLREDLLKSIGMVAEEKAPAPAAA